MCEVCAELRGGGATPSHSRSHELIASKRQYDRDRWDRAVRLDPESVSRWLKRQAELDEQH